jgi:hypothetical protein
MFSRLSDFKVAWPVYENKAEHVEIWHHIYCQQLNASHGQKLVPSTRRDDRTMTGLRVLIL